MSQPLKRSFQNGLIKVSGSEWLASNHLHLYIDATPDHSLDEIVHAIREYLEQERANLLPAWQPSNQPVWEQGYFAEGIG